MRTTKTVINDTLVIKVEYYAGAQFGWLTARTETYTREQVLALLRTKTAPGRDQTRFAIA